MRRGEREALVILERSRLVLRPDSKQYVQARIACVKYVSERRFSSHTSVSVYSLVRLAVMAATHVGIVTVGRL